MMKQRKPFNVSRIYGVRGGTPVYGARPREESGPSLISKATWGVFEDGTHRLIATWPTKKQALEAARQLNDEEERSAEAWGASDSALRSNERGA